MKRLKHTCFLLTPQLRWNCKVQHYSYLLPNRNSKDNISNRLLKWCVCVCVCVCVRAFVVYGDILHEYMPHYEDILNYEDRDSVQ